MSIQSITNFSELKEFLESEWGIFDTAGKSFIDDPAILDKNSVLEEYATLIGKKVVSFEEQDYLYIEMDKDQGRDIIIFINENQGNWSLATLPDSEIVLSDAWLSDDGKADNEFAVMPFGLQECLISFTLQELAFRNSRRYSVLMNDDTLEKYKQISQQIWVNKKYNIKDGDYSFYYNDELGGLVFIRYGRLCEITCKDGNSMKKLKEWVDQHS